MDQVVKKYTRDDVTVVWKPDQCIHSTVCWKGLIKVFNPRMKPWIDMNGADTQRIMEQVSKCPSGALSYVVASKETTADNTETQMTTAVEVAKNGPLMVYGNLKVKHHDGSETVKNKVTAFCRCGASANKPFCDGSHIRIGFKDE